MVVLDGMGKTISSCSPRELLNKGLKLLNQANASEALNLFDVVYKSQPGLAGLNYVRAKALVELGRLDEAKQACEAELRKQPEHNGAQRMLERLGRRDSGGISEQSSQRLQKPKINLFDKEPSEILQAKQLVKSYYQKRLNDVWCCADHPVWFDHEVDYHLWPKNLFWLERGVYGRMVMRPGCRVLDLCCGDGYYSDAWYSTIASSIDACDNDEGALRFASQKHANPKINYHRVDILTEPFPRPEYDVITWFEAIEHFSEEQIVHLLRKIDEALQENGTLIGSTPLVQKRGAATNRQHDREFTSQEDLEAILKKVFVNVQTWVAIYPQRTTCYFKAVK